MQKNNNDELGFNTSVSANYSYQKLFEYAAFGIAICRLMRDEHGKAVDFEHLQVNAATKHHTGFPPDMLQGKRALDIAAPEDVSNIIEMYEKVVDQGHTCKYDQYFSLYKRHLEVGAFPLENDLFVITFVDITHRKNAEKRLARQNYYLEKAQELGQIGTWELDLLNNILFWTDENCRIFGVPEGSLVDYEIFLSKVHPDDRSYVDQEWRAAVKGKPYDIEHRLMLDGEIKWVREKADIKYDNSGKAISAIGFTQDISGRKMLENQLLQARKLESIGTLAGGIAHEFNNILTIIIGNNEIIMDQLAESDLSIEHSNEIRLAGFRAKDIVKQLLTFSRQDDSKQRLLNINNVIEDSIRMIRSTTPANIEIIEKISPDCYPIFGDVTQINQILINLCNNAVDVLPVSGGILEITMSNIELGSQDSDSGQKVKLQVKDNGCGISQKIIDRIFEPYFTTKEIGRGSGIGLAVVRGIVENHGARIFCESQEGYGTTFTILFPAYFGQKEIRPVLNEVSSGKGEEILFVDDDPAIAKLAKFHIESFGYRVCSTTSPREALQLVQNEPNRFKLVISDMAMPHLPGDQLISQIHAIRSDIPTIICSGYSSRMSEAKASEMGIDAFVLKPFDKNNLARIIFKTLNCGE